MATPRSVSRRRGVLAVALLLLGPAAFPGAGADGGGDVQYVAQSLWGAKHLVGLDESWLLLRPLWIAKPTGEGVKIGLIDTGVDDSHPDLTGQIALWKDFVAGKPSPYDDHGHGTHVAGILVAHGHVQPNPLKFYWITGARGVAPGASLIVAKAMGSDGKGEDSRVADAILWAIDPNGDGDLSDGADVINLSIGIDKAVDPGTGHPRAFNFVGSATRSAVNLALLRGVVVVISSGNEGDHRVAEPADIPSVISVGAVDRDGKVTAFSNYGRELDLVAPGVLVSTFPKALDTEDFAQDGYAGMAGTSMAAPMVSGVVALLLEANPALRAKGANKDYHAKVDLVQDLLVKHAKPTSDEAARQGAGVLDAYATLKAADAGGGGLSWSGIVLLALVAAFLAWLVVVIPLRRRRAKKAARLAEEKATEAEEAAGH